MMRRSNGKGNGNGRGRGPALHEALQRINRRRWHAPGTDLFDCGPMNFDVPDSDSGDDDDDLHPWADPRPEALRRPEDRSTTVRNTRDGLRREIARIQKFDEMIGPSKSAPALYRAVKLQLSRSVGDDSALSFRLKGPAVDFLLSDPKVNHIFGPSDRRTLRKAKKLPAPAECAHPECDVAILTPSNLCSVHLLQSRENEMFESARRAIGAAVEDGPKSDEKYGDTRRYIDCGKIPAGTSKPSPRKRLKPPSAIKPAMRNRKKVSPDPNVHNSAKNSYNLFNNCSPFLASNGIDRGVTSAFSSRNDASELNVCSNSSAYESSEDIGIDGLGEVELIGSENHNQHIVDPDVVAEVLALHESGELPLELPPPEPPQENNLDLSTVFNDFFTEHNGEYIPTREETEELERALQAVQNVKSMEKVSSSQHSSLLDSLLDEKDLAETLASLPDVFSNIPPIKTSTDNGAELSSLSS